MSGLYQAFRSNGAATFYEASHSAVFGDVLVIGLVTCLCILAISFYIVLPGVRGKEGFFAFVKITASLFIGGVIIVSNWAMTWEVGGVSTGSKYRAGTGAEIEAHVGVNIGLRGVNVTLRGEPEKQLNETINYNEHFSWEGGQGRIGFGPFAGRFQQEYRAGQARGLPLPILWAAEYFTLDGEGIRWGRHYRQAGWYAHILLWLALPLWFLSNVLFLILLRYGANMLGLTGAVMVGANVVWAKLRNVTELTIPFTADAVITFRYGAAFWLCFLTGLMCIILAGIIRFMDMCYPHQIAFFFNVDVIQDSEDLPVETGDDSGKNPETEIETDENEPAASNGVHPKPSTSAEELSDEDSDGEIYCEEVVIAMPIPRRSTRGLTQRFQKPRRRPLPPPPKPAGAARQDSGDYDSDDYINLQHELYDNEEAIRMEPIRL